MRKASIRVRLTLWYATILVITFGLFAAAIWLALRQSIRSTIDSNLRSRLESVRTYIDQQMREGGSHVEQEISEDAELLAGDAVIRLVSSSGTSIYRSRAMEGWDDRLPSADDLPLEGATATVGIHGELFRVLTAPVSIGVAQIGIPLQTFQRIENLLAWTALLGSPLLVLIAAGGGYWMSGRALRPVDEVAAKARSISAQNLAERLPYRGTDDELDRLSTTLNGMLARLQSSFATVTQFTADASHELRTPVALIRTTAEVASSKSRSIEEHERAWEVVLTQTVRMSQLIGDLLILARVDSGADEPHPELMDASSILREVCDEMQVMIDVAGLRLGREVPAACPLFGDPEDLRRILLILLDNAIKYTPPGGELSIQLELTNSPDNPVCVINVRDTGIGIAASDLPHIFDRFYRAAKDRSRATGGSGLGLPIAKHLAERQHGFIHVQSTPGIGSVFSLYLPAGSASPTQVHHAFRMPEHTSIRGES